MQKARKLRWYAVLVPARVFACEKMASFTTSDEVFCIGDGGGPVKTSLESFADQVSQGHVVAAVPE